MLTDRPEQNTEKAQQPCTQIYITITNDLIKNKTTGAGQYIRCLSSTHSPLYLSPLLYINSPQPQRSSSSHSPWWEIHNISNSSHNPLPCNKYPVPHPRLPWYHPSILYTTRLVVLWEGTNTCTFHNSFPCKNTYKAATVAQHRYISQ